MNSRESAHAKKCALTTPDWDTYQVIIRTCLNPVKALPDPQQIDKLAPLDRIRLKQKHRITAA